MGNFKDFLSSDLDNVFFNEDEFAETHTVDGKEMKVIVDNDALTERKLSSRTSKPSDGVYVGDILFHVMAKVYEGRPAIGKILKFDGKLYRISDFQEEEGMYTITIVRNKA
ncbi:hypothetical protein [Clostridium aceticum]|nr:hypothetical protein [Clostridium aceticum]KJF27911.1 hypothetical protein TZ02_04865 [Clostridium aceticum]